MAGGFLPDYGQTGGFWDSSLGKYIQNIPQVSPGLEAITGMFGGQAAPVPGLNAPMPAPATPPAPTPQLPQAPTGNLPKQPSFDPNQIINIPGRQFTVPTNSVVQQQQPLPQEIEAFKQSTEAQQEMIEAQKSLMESQAEWQAKKAEVQSQMIDIENAHADKRAMIEKEKQAEVDFGFQKLNALSEDVKSMKIEDFWSSRSTGQKIMAAIAVGLGAAGSALTGQRNMAADMLQNAIEQDLAIQKSNMAKAYTDIETQKGILAETSAMYDDQLTAEEAARVAAYRGVIAELETMASRAQSDEMRQSIGVTVADLKNRAAQYEQQFLQTLRSNVTQQYATKVIPGRTTTLGAEVAKQQGYVDYRDMVKEKKTKQFVPVYQGFAATKGDADELKKLSAAYGKQKEIVNKLLDFRKNFGQLKPAQRERIKPVYEGLLIQLRLAANMGTPQDAEMRRLEEKYRDPNTIMAANVDSNLRGILDNIAISENNDIKAYGISPAIPETIPMPLRRPDYTKASTYRIGSK